MCNLTNQLAISVRGASHITSNKPLQDYSLAVNGDNFSIAVVCDGHGGEKHFRSEIGSKLAAEITRDKLIEFFEANKTFAALNENLDEKLSDLKISIITCWQISIEKYTKDNPFTEDELKKGSSTFNANKAFDIAIPYGTTVLATLVCDDYYLVLMVGDGAIVKINSDFQSSIVTFPGKKVYDDGPHSATDSLCSQDAYKSIFFSYGKIENEKLAFGLCSDGMSEAFATDDTMISVFNNYINYYAEEGLEKSISAITDSLNEMSSSSYMKDDISVAFATLHLDAFDKRSKNTTVKIQDVEDCPSKKNDSKN